jgi:uncharacterized membrane protein YfcA
VEHAKTVLYWLLAIIGALFLAAWIRAVRRARHEGALPRGPVPTPYQLLVGVITDFLDTWGIGSFATTTSLFRARRTIDDRLLPGTLNVGHTLPTILQAYLFFEKVEVETTTLVSMIGAAVLGAWLGAGFVSRWSKPRVQRVMGLALLAIGGVMAHKLLRGDPIGGKSIGLSGAMLAIGVTANFVLGVLMTMGIGLYAPCLLLVSLLGMNQDTGFPIMMGSCAFLMPLASLRFLRERCCDLRASAGLAIGGIPAVLAAVYLFEKTNLKVLTWIILAVVAYTAISLLLASRRAPAADCGAVVPPIDPKGPPSHG